MAPDNSRPPLTDQERRLLTDPAAFAEAAARGPVILNDRSVDGLEINAMAFAAVTWTGVDFQGTKLRATVFTNAELREVTLTGCTFDDVAFERCRLDQCAFDFAECTGLRISDSNALKVSLSACTCKNTVFERSQFQSATDRASTFARTRWSDVCWSAPEMRGTRFDQAQIEDSTIVGGTLAGVTFTDGKGRSLLVQGTLVDGVDFVLGTWVALTFDQIRGRSLRLTEVSATALSLLACGELVGVAIAGGSVTGLAIDRCPTLGLVGFSQVQMRGLMVSDAVIDGASWQRCSITDDSSIERTSLAGLDLGQSILDGVAIRDCEFTIALGLAGANIHGLVLERVRYAPGLDLRADGANYGPGARFPTRR
jgi:uncharacterized protein YjbI with pentapeptide repeats